MLRISLSGENGVGKVALIDDEDFEKVYNIKWHVSKIKNNEYAAGAKTINKKRIYFTMHRLILQLNGNVSVDHIDHNGLNNQKNNLRICTQTQNIVNSRKARTWHQKETSSKYKGVSFSKRSKKWRACMTINNRFKYIGTFSVETDAAKAYDDAMINYYGEFANLNFPENYYARNL
jgi:hypothetical protein